MTLAATVRVGPRRTEIRPDLFGAFFEHFGTIVNGGVWDVERAVPRADVLGAMRGLAPRILRYPGGQFADLYHWRDGVGPRPRVTYPAKDWRPMLALPGLDEADARRFVSDEPNSFGTDEFLAYCGEVGAEPALTVNVGTGTPDEAAAWVDYTAGRVRTWFIGNELYLPAQPWKPVHLDPDEYARAFEEFALAMRARDPDLRLVGTGLLPSDATLLGYPDWNEQLLAGGARPDLLSVHFYFPGLLGRPLGESFADHLQVATGGHRLAQQLDELAAGLDGRAAVSLDEWSLWSAMPQLLETNHRVSDGLYFAGVYNRLIERADVVHLAMLSQVVNSLGAIQTRGDGMFLTSAYHVARLYRELCGERMLSTEIECDVVAVPPFAAASGTDLLDEVFDLESADAEAGPTALHARPLDVTWLDAVATGSESATTVFLTNRSLDESMLVQVTGAGTDGLLRVVHGDSPWAASSVTDPNAIRTSEWHVRTAAVELPPCTVAALVTTT